jgi:hypothetical protein
MGIGLLLANVQTSDPGRWPGWVMAPLRGLTKINRNPNLPIYRFCCSKPRPLPPAWSFYICKGGQMQIHFPRPTWGRGWTASGAVTSRCGPGEGVRIVRANVTLILSYVLARSCFPSMDIGLRGFSHWPFALWLWTCYCGSLTVFPCWYEPPHPPPCGPPSPPRGARAVNS